MTTTTTTSTATTRAVPPLSVLVVEDESLVARDLTYSLGDMGYDVTATVASSMEAIEAATLRRPDVVLMDIRIRGQLDGIDTAHILRQRFRVPVIFLTAHTDAGTLGRAAQSQPYGYLVKPFSSKDLHSAIELARRRHDLDHRLTERQRWMSSALRSIADGVIACDAGQLVELMNPTAEALTGWTEADARGRPITEVYRTVSEPIIASGTHPVVAALHANTTQTSTAEIRLVGRDGLPGAFVEDSVAPIIVDGALLGAVLVFRDVGARRRADQALARIDRVGSLGAMAASVGHEINNPLASNLGNIGFALRALRRASAEDAGLARRMTRTVDALLEAEHAATRVAAIVSDLQALGGPIDDSLHPVDVRACVEWALRVSGNQLRHAAKVVADLHEVPRVQGSEGRLAQAMMDLLTSVAQDLDGRPEERELRVGLHPGDDAGRPGIVIEVERRDHTGPVSAEAEIGLAVARGIFEQLGGNFAVTRAPGQQYRVAAWLPGDIAAAPPPPPEKAIATPAPAVTPRRARILIVDDETLLARSVQRMLELELDHEVEVTGNGRDALARLADDDRFDVILCDLMMPGISGMDVYEEISARSPALAPRFAFMTGGAFTPRATEFLASIPNRRLRKPFDYDELVAVIASVRADCAAPPVPTPEAVPALEAVPVWVD